MVLWLFRKHEIISNGSLIDARGFPSLLLLGPSFLAEWRHKWRPYTLQCDWPTPRRFSFGTFSKTSRAAPAIFLLFSLRTWNQFQKLGILFGRSQGSLTFSSTDGEVSKKSVDLLHLDIFGQRFLRLTDLNDEGLFTHINCVLQKNGTKILDAKWNKNPRCRISKFFLIWVTFNPRIMVQWKNGSLQQ